VPCQFEEQSLLRVHLRRFARRDPEESRLEQIDVADQPSRPGVRLRRLAARGVIVESGGPASGIDLRDRVPAGGQQFPEGVQVRCSWKPAGSADDRDRSVTHSTDPQCRGGERASQWRSDQDYTLYLAETSCDIIQAEIAPELT